MSRRTMVAWVLAAALAGTGCVVEHESHRDDSGGGGGETHTQTRTETHVEVEVEGGGGGGGGGGHRDGGEYSNLPDKGLLENYLPPNWQGDTTLTEGRYRLRNDRIHFQQGGLKIHGKGIGLTVIIGDVTAYGDKFVFDNLTVTGDFKYRGNYSNGTFRVKGNRDSKGIGNMGTFVPH